jgi:hypothetical protein
MKILSKKETLQWEGWSDWSLISCCTELSQKENVLAIVNKMMPTNPSVEERVSLVEEELFTVQ